MGDDIMEKAFTWTLCFDTLRISQIQNSVKNKATVNVSWVCYYTSLFILVVTIGIRQGGICIHIGVRLRVARFDRVGNARAFKV